MIEVGKVAELARLKISENEASSYKQQLEAIIKHFEEIRAIDTANVEPMITPSEIELYIREDNCVQELSVEQALANAPERSGNLFKVPPVVG